jgi:nucleotide-binding universal stress UspA family protein
MQQDRGSSPVAVLVEEREDGASAVEWAAREAGMLGRRLVLVTLTTAPQPTFSTVWSPAPSGATGACLLADAAEAVRRTDPRLRIELEVLNGPPGRTLLERTAGYRLLAVPQRGRRSFAGIPVGSWAPWLAANAWCPVVLVPDGERPDPDDEAGGAEYERPLSCACQGSWT